MSELTALKNVFRIRVKGFYQDLSKEEYSKKSKNLSINLQKFMTDMDSGVWGCFSPLADEPDWSIEIDAIVESEDFAYNMKRKDGAMTFHLCKKEDLVPSEAYGKEILCPPTKDNEVSPDHLLVPGLAFSRDGNRLGRGRGFYDRFISNYRGLKVGICFAEQIIDDIPIEEHDEKMNVVITDKEIILCSMDHLGSNS